MLETMEKELLKFT